MQNFTIELPTKFEPLFDVFLELKKIKVKSIQKFEPTEVSHYVFKTSKVKKKQIVRYISKFDSMLLMDGFMITVSLDRLNELLNNMDWI